MNIYSERAESWQAMKGVLTVVATLLLVAAPCHAETEWSRASITDTSVEWPGWAAIWRVASLRDYNTRLVVISTTLLGLSCGMIGSFLLLRKRSLMGDALSHATLPGIALAFLFLVYAGGSGKSLAGLLAGAAVTGVLGFSAVLLVRNLTRIKDDAAMGIILSVFFGAGVALLGMVQTMPEGSAAGLESFIYGKTASMVLSDFYLLVTVTGIATVLSILLFKEFRLLCFDQEFAAAQGWPVHLLDVLMLGFVTAVTVAGLQAVGLILIIAFLITPAAAARFWTDRAGSMLFVAAMIGGASGWLGASVSALLPRLPAGAIIVLVAAALFILSMLLGTARGVILRIARQAGLRRKIARQHLLRAVFETLEAHQPGASQLRNEPVDLGEVLRKRAWSPGELARQVARADRDDLIAMREGDRLQLSEAGFAQASRATRNHRLWEMYLINYADIAPTHVDRDADAVEHVLGEDLVNELELAFARREQERERPVAMPESPHPLGEQTGVFS